MLKWRLCMMQAQDFDPEETGAELSDEDEADEEAADNKAPHTGARSILRFFGFGQGRSTPVSAHAHTMQCSRRSGRGISIDC